ncbi:MAG: hypothetical protein ACQETE_09750 [Bacteroidota bacterium]
MRTLTILSLTALLIGFISGCDNTGTDPQLNAGEGDVKIQFKTNSNNLAKTATIHNSLLANDSLVIEGTNGKLQIDDIRFIVSEFKLEPADADEETDSLDTEAEDFEAGPFWVDLPLGSDSLTLGNSPIKAGVYEELEFEVEDLDLDDEEDEDPQLQPLADSIRSEFPDWPDDASLLVIGTFTPTNGSPQPFKVYAEAEIEIEREFSPPLEVIEGNNLRSVLSINFHPASWFENSDGSVIELDDFDWDQTEELLEFEAKFEDGVEEIDSDKEEDDGDDDDHDEDEDEDDDEDGNDD